MDTLTRPEQEALDLAIAETYEPFCFEDLSEEEIQKLWAAEYDESVVNKLVPIL